jgi:flagellar motor switch protein FliG
LVLRSSAHFRELSRGTFFGNNKRIEFGRQSKRECEELQRRLQREPAYIIAAVLRHLPAAKAAGILRLFPDDERNEIIARMARPVPIYLGDWEKVMTSSA